MIVIRRFFSSRYGQGRKTALVRLKVITALLTVLGGCLLVCAGLGLEFYENGIGVPYYAGGFVAGAPASLAALVSIGMLLQAVGKDTDDSALKQLAPFMSCQHTITVLLVPACFVGSLFTGIGGFSGDEDDRPTGTNKFLAIVILVCCILTLFVAFVSMCTVRKYGKYFGVIINKRGRQKVGVTNSSSNATGRGESSGTTVNVRTNMNVFTTDVNNQHLSQLEQQNRLLQQQVNLQQQLLNQQQQQSQFTGGLYPPPMPSRFDDSDPAYPPTAPPPPYEKYS